MDKRSLIYIKNIIPCLILSAITGIITGIVIFLFKNAASYVVALSDTLYGAVRENPAFIPLLILGVAVLGLVSALTTKYLAHCKGGGIPTAIAILRGLVDFSWIRNIVVVFASALMTYLGGVPLGTEGPSVQMGTAIGRGTVRMFAKKHNAWDRYIMTGGACAGFAAATSAPLTGIFFAFEDAHRRFSPMIFMSAASAAIAGSATITSLDKIHHGNTTLFSFTPNAILPLRYIWIAVIVGIICGLAATLFTLTYRAVGDFIQNKLSSLTIYIKIPIIFVLVSILGFFSSELLGSGHSLTETLLEGHGAFYMIIIYFIIRALLLIISNNAGITGGLFLPTLAFGAMIGALCGKILLYFSLIDISYYPIIVIIGIASFLSASSRTPITAVLFSLEALGGFANILPIALGVTIAYIIIEAIGIPSFTESVVESKVESYSKGKISYLTDVKFETKKNSFAVGKEIRDILWPATCVVTSVRKHSDRTHHKPFIEEGDILHLHFTSYNPDATLSLLEDILGSQESDIIQSAQITACHHQVPDL